MDNLKAIRRLLVFCAAPTLVLGAQHIGHAATYKWTGASGSDWHIASNWAPRGVPGSADSAVIDSGLVEVRRDAVVSNLLLGVKAELKNSGRLTVRRTTTSRGLVVGAGSLNILPGASASFSISNATIAAAMARSRAQAGQSKITTISFQPIKNRGVLRATVGESTRLRFDSIENRGTTSITASGQVVFKSIRNYGVIRLTASKPTPSRAAALGSLKLRLNTLSLLAANAEAPGEAPIALGDVVNEQGGEIFLSGSQNSGPDFVANAFENQGKMHFDDAATVVAAGFNNEAGGLLSLQGDTAIVPQGGTSPTLENLGTVRKLGEGSAQIALEWVNRGQLSIDAGTLQLRAPAGTSITQLAGLTTLNGGSLQVLGADAAPGTLNLQGGILNGSGVIDGNVLNGGGAIQVGFSPGIITINGNYTQTTNGTLNMEIGGTSPGTGYDQLVVNGTASLAGTLTMLKYGTSCPLWAPRSNS
jgi:hypothetical protein